MVTPWAENVLFGCLGMGEDERLLVLVEEPLRPAGEALCAAAGSGTVEVIEVPARRLTVVQERVLKAVRGADVIVSLLGPVDLTREHPVLRAALAAFRAAGRGRWAMGSFLDAEAFERELQADWATVQVRADELAARLRGADAIRLTAPGGTDLRLRIGGRPVHVESGRLAERGAVGNLPGGEVFVAPLEASAEGRLVVDSALGDIDLDRPVTLTLRAGRVVSIEGGEAARAMERRLGQDPWARTIGEFGLGANPYARPRGRVTIDEKALGTAHVALGWNLGFGGANPADSHYDCVVREVRIDA